MGLLFIHALEHPVIATVVLLLILVATLYFLDRLGSKYTQKKLTPGVTRAKKPVKSKHTEDNE